MFLKCEWCNGQDDAESQPLKSNESIKDENILQKQIYTILIQIKSASDNIQRLTGENRLLKNDIINLHNQLSEKCFSIPEPGRRRVPVAAPSPPFCAGQLSVIHLFIDNFLTVTY